MDWLNGIPAIHILVVLIGAVGFFRYWRRTGFWLPRYVHYLAAIAFLVGVGLLWITPEDAPIQRDRLAVVKKALFLLLFPAIVYVVFVLKGGQHAAYQRQLTAAPCRFCGQAAVAPETPCPHCGQRAAV